MSAPCYQCVTGDHENNKTIKGTFIIVRLRKVIFWANRKDSTDSYYKIVFLKALLD